MRNILKQLKYRSRSSLLALVLLVYPSLNPSSIRSAASTAPAFNSSAFATNWQRVDLPVQELPDLGRGYTWGPVVEGSQILTSESYNGASRQVQYFDKARMEINQPEANSSDLFYVTTGLLVKELVTGQRQDGDNTFTQLPPSTIPVAGDPNDNGANPYAPTYASFQKVVTFTGNQNGMPNNTGDLITFQLDRNGQVSKVTPPENHFLSQYDSATKHNIADVFVNYGNRRGLIWNNNGQYQQGDIFFSNPTYVLGRPITEPYWTRARVSGVEKDVLVQLFERRVLTYTPANSPAYQVEMGNVGQHYFKWRYLLNKSTNISWPVPVVASPISIPPANKEGTSLLDLTYCKVGSVELKLDFYFPPGFDSNATKALPSVIFVHGGSWVGGDKSTVNNFTVKEILLARGMVVVAPNYRLAPQFRFPAQLEDIKCAVRYLTLNASVYQLDPQHIGVLGESAGGHLAALMGLKGIVAGFDSLPASSSSNSFSSLLSIPSPAVRSVVELYGPNDLTQPEQLEKLKPAIMATFGTADPTTLSWASPITYVPAQAKNLPAFLIIQGEADKLVLPSQAQSFYQKLKACEAQATLQMVANAGHGFSYEPGGTAIPKDTRLALEITRFFEQ